MVEVSQGQCKVQKFVGRELRARPYTVNRADIIAVKPWEFRGDQPIDSEENDCDTRNQHHSGTIHDSIGPEGEEIQNVSEVEDEGTVGEGTGVVTRSGRRVRPPAHLADYVQD